MPLKIPDADKVRLKRLSALTPSDFQDLYAALQTTEPLLNPDEFIKNVAAKTKLDLASISDVVRVLIGLYWIYADKGFTPETVADEIIQTALEEKTPEPKAGWGALKGEIIRLLALEKTLGVAAKAVYVAAQYDKHFHGARVMTDARPIFGANPSASPVAFVVSHVLQIDMHENGDDKEVHLALDRDDLQQLRAAIDRALTKEKSLRECLQKTGLSVLVWEE